MAIFLHCKILALKPRSKGPRALTHILVGKLFQGAQDAGVVWLPAVLHAQLCQGLEEEDRLQQDGARVSQQSDR